MSSYAVTVLKIIASSGKWVLCKALKHSPKSGINTASATAVEKLLEPFVDVFHYDKLSSSTSIRLLKIVTGGNGEYGNLIRCSLHDYEVGNAPPYRALSYTWGIDHSERGSALKTLLSIVAPKEIFSFVRYFIKVALNKTASGAGARTSSAKSKSLGRFLRRIGRPMRRHWSYMMSKVSHTLSFSKESKVKDDKRLILCNGKAIYIKPNLYNALRQIPGQEGQFWWIDAICIDQSNDIERSVQVNLMAEIFGNAERVIVWLGKASVLTEKAPKFMANLPPVVAKPMANAETAERESKIRQEFKRNPDETLWTYPSKWLAIIIILARRWFSRVWVLQETVLAKEIDFYLGTQKMSQETVINGLEWLIYLIPRQRIIGLGGPFLHPLLRFAEGAIRTLKARDYFSAGGKWLLEDYIKLCRGRSSTDDRDMVFAGLALLKRSGERGLGTSNRLQADYTKSALQVYQDCAESLIYGGTGLYTLSLVGEKRDGDLPSWVPDLSNNLRPVPMRSLGGDTFAAFTTNDAFLRVSITGSRLRLSAIEFDEIVTVGESYRGLMVGTGRSNDNSSLHVLSIISSLGGIYSPTGEPIMTAFWRTLLANVFQGKYPAPSSLNRSFVGWLWYLFCHRKGLTSIMNDSSRRRVQYDIVGDFSFNSSQLPQWEEFFSSHESPEYSFEEIKIWDGGIDNTDHRLMGVKFIEITQPFASAFNKSYEGRRIFLTKKGYIGLGPESIQENDAVMLLEGGYVPYIFRKQEYIPIGWLKLISEGISNSRAFAEIQMPENRYYRRTSTWEPVIQDWRLIGEGYVHGIMHGEALKDKGPQILTTINVI